MDANGGKQTNNFTELKNVNEDDSHATIVSFLVFVDPSQYQSKMHLMNLIYEVITLLDVPK